MLVDVWKGIFLVEERNCEEIYLEVEFYGLLRELLG